MIKGKDMNYCNTCPSSIRGLCCYYSYFDGVENFITHPCKYLSKKTGRCTIYKKRFKINPLCLIMEKALKEGQLPELCMYVQKSEIIPIRPWKTINKNKVKEMIKYGI